MRKLMLMVAMVAFVLVALAPAALAQEAKISEDVWAKKGEAKAGGAAAKVEPCPEAKAGDVVAKAECPKPKEEAKPAPKMEEKKEEKKELPKTGGGSASLFALGAGALLVAGGLLARRIVR